MVKPSSPACLCCRTISYWIFLGLNIVVPILLLPVDYRYYHAVAIEHLNDEQMIPYTKSLYVVTNGLTNFLQVWSGVYMILGVIKISSFFRKMNAEEHVNNRVMLLHAFAFGLYSVSVTIWFIFNTIYGIDPSEQNLEFELYALVFVIISDFVSQALLVLILWDLGSPKSVKNNLSFLDQRVESASSINANPPIVAPFDAEAELHARIWNSFQNEEVDVWDPDKYRINADSISSLKSSEVFVASGPV
jgi:hypothetical protein